MHLCHSDSGGLRPSWVHLLHPWSSLTKMQLRCSLTKMHLRCSPRCHHFPTYRCVSVKSCTTRTHIPHTKHEKIQETREGGVHGVKCDQIMRLNCTTHTHAPPTKHGKTMENMRTPTDTTTHTHKHTCPPSHKTHRAHAEHTHRPRTGAERDLCAVFLHAGMHAHSGEHAARHVKKLHTVLQGACKRTQNTQSSQITHAQNTHNNTH